MEKMHCRAAAFQLTGDRSLAVTVDGADQGHQAGTWRSVVAGDWASVRLFEQVADRPVEQLYGDLLPMIREADLSAVNLECALGGTEPLAKDGPNLRGSVASAQALADAGFDVVCLGNNHVMDYGCEGLNATLRACHQAGLTPTGAGLNVDQSYQPALMSCGGVQVGLLSLADREEGDATWCRPGVAPVWDVQLFDRIRQVRSAVDVLIVVLHGGKEYLPVPSPYWYELVLAIAGAGPDLVVGHHPHVPQGVTWRLCDDGRHVPVIFSTGNFVFRPAASDGLTIPPRTADGYLVQADWAGRRLVGLQLVPYVITDLGPRRPADLQMLHFEQLMRGLSDPLSHRQWVDAWFDAAVEHLWEHGYCDRLQALTALLCADDPKMRHARSHHRSPAHLSLIDRVIERKLTGQWGRHPSGKYEQLQAWFAGHWPCPPTEVPDAN